VLPIQTLFTIAEFPWNEKFHLRWVPHIMTPDRRRRRLEICGRLLPILEARELDSFRMLVLGDDREFALE
jgi:hypothetical protein